MTNAIANLTVPIAREAFEALPSPHLFIGGGSPSAAIEVSWNLASIALGAVTTFTPSDLRGVVPAPAGMQELESVEELVQHLEGVTDRMSAGTYDPDAALTQLIIISSYGDITGIRGQMEDLDPLTASLRGAVKHLLCAGRGHGIQVIITDPDTSVPYQETSVIFHSFGALVTLDDDGEIESVRHP